MSKKIILPFLFLVVVAIGAGFLTPYLHQFFLTLGITKVEISIAGTGSMYPTFPKGEGTNEIIQASQTVAWPKMQLYPS